MDGLQDYPQLQYILSLQETPAVAMADGYARATGRPGVVNVHIAPGLANAMSMIYNAWKGGTPLVSKMEDKKLVVEYPAVGLSCTMYEDRVESCTILILKEISP